MHFSLIRSWYTAAILLQRILSMFGIITYKYFCSASLSQLFILECFGGSCPSTGFNCHWRWMDDFFFFFLRFPARILLYRVSAFIRVTNSFLFIFFGCCIFLFLWIADHQEHYYLVHYSRVHQEKQFHTIRRAKASFHHSPSSLSSCVTIVETTNPAFRVLR